MTSIQRSLLQQAARRLWFAFLATLIVVGAASAAFYYAALQRSAEVHAANLADFYRDRLRHLGKRWDIQALQLKNQLELSRVLENQDDLQNAAESFFTIMGEEAGFENVHIDDKNDRLLFLRGATLAKVPPHSDLDISPRWYFDPTTRIVHRVYSLPIWLGTRRGTGHLHWYVPIDNGLLREMATIDGQIYALWAERIAASSAGSAGLADAALLAAETTVIEPDRLSVQRRIDWGDEAEHPMLVVRHSIARPISSSELWAATLTTLVAMGLVLAVALGAWLWSTGRRMALLGEASRQFGNSRTLSPELASALAQAGAESGDEIREVAAALGALIRSVVDRERERDEKEAALKEAQRRLAEAQQVSGLCHFEVDLATRRIVMNEQFFRVHRLRLEDVGGYDCDEKAFKTRFLHPEDAAEMEESIRRCIAAGDPTLTYEAENRFYCGDGVTRWTRVRFRLDVDAAGAPRWMLGTAEDIDERKRADSQLRLMATVFESSGEAILITDADNCIIAANAAFTRLTGYALDEVRGKNPKVLSAGRTTKEEYAAMWRSIIDAGYWRGEVWDRRKDGTTYPKWLSITAVRSPQGRIVNYIASFSDITEHKQAEERIKHLAHHDVLTGLPNRFSLQGRLAQAVAGAQRNREKLAVLFIDLDRFKTINDTLGHYIGDELLVAVARRLQQCVRASDIVARLGGDEFVVVLSGATTTGDIVGVAEKILAQLGQPHNLEGHELHATPSVGISLYPDDGADDEALMKNADIAMYHAKSLGRNNYQFFDASMNKAAVERLMLEGQLRQAIDRQEFLLHYQPQIDLGSGRVAGVEALVRWQHPDNGLVPPAKFIPILEDTGLIVQAGEWVLRTACREIKRWQELGVRDVQVAVNLSARQFRQKNLAATVEEVLHGTGIAPGQLELEITESVAMDNPQETIAQLRELKRMGVMLAIDDFGTGYSSLNYLKLFPINRLKLDRSFVADIETDPNDAAICAATIGLAHNLGLDVVAEGVETQAQADYLRRLDCDIVQGYFYARPQPGEEAAQWIAARNGRVAS